MGQTFAMKEEEVDLPQIVAPIHPLSHRCEHDLASKSRMGRQAQWVILGLVGFFLLAAAIIVMGVLQINQRIAVQQPGGLAMDQIVERVNEDTDEGSEQATIAPDLCSLIGDSVDEALDQLGQGATIVSDTSIEAGDAARRELVVVLAWDPSDADGVSPLVKLRVEAGSSPSGSLVTAASYEASLKNLGFGAPSFRAAVERKKLVERTLQEVGLYVSDLGLTLPEDRRVYSSYAGDGTTLENESYGFDGIWTQAGKSYHWDVLLDYDYLRANAQGNLAYTDRSVAVTISL